MTGPASDTGVDLSKYPNAKTLVDRCEEFFEEVENLTPGHELEAYLNANQGPGNPYYDDFADKSVWAYRKVGSLTSKPTVPNIAGVRSTFPPTKTTSSALRPSTWKAKKSTRGPTTFILMERSTA